MATNNSVQQSQQQQQQPPPQQQQQQSQQQQQQPPPHHFQQLNTSPHHCKECGLYLNSAESLEVHLQYHKENLMKNWGTPEVKEERASPPNHVNSYGNYSDQQQYFGMDSNQQYTTQDYPIHKAPVQSTNYRYHPYQSQHSPYDRSQHSPYDRSQTNSHSGHFIYTTDPQQTQIKTEDDAQSEILDLDSHKVQRMFMNGPEQKLFTPSDFISNNVTTTTTTQDNVVVVGNGLIQPNYGANNVTTNSQDMIVGNGGINIQTNYGGNVTTTTTTSTSNQQQQQQQDNSNMGNNYNQPNYVTTTTPQHQDGVTIGNGGGGGGGVNMQQNYHRPFEHLPSPGNNPVISSTQVAPNPQPTVSPAAKSTNWKSNEARRPKTYNCTACNKWFTSSGHLKRHYNTTLHKNAVKTSGQPDPASLPISAHHHPARESSSSRESNQSNSPPQEDTNSSPPNGEAGLSPGIPRGLLSPHFMGPPPPHQSPPTPSPLMMPTAIENSAQFQMYPNGSAPHVTQDTVTNSLNITGEYNNNNHQVNTVNLGQQREQQQQQQQNNHPLPSFEQIQAHRYAVISYGNANVGGGGSVTAPYTYCPDPLEITESPRILCYKTEEEEYRLTVLTAADPAPFAGEAGTFILPEPYTDDLTKLSPPSPEKAHIKRDYEESTSSPQITSTVQTKPSRAPSKSGGGGGGGGGAGILKCLDCDKNFNKACYLTQHNKTFHCGAKPIKCSRCGKRFENDIIYQEHFQKHLGDKPHKCDQCPKQFNHKTDLRRHLCLHSGNKPFQCDICGKGFIRKDHMQKHCETHYRKTQNKVVGFRRATTVIATD